jgi:hypothetical protein
MKEYEQDPFAQVECNEIREETAGRSIQNIRSAGLLALLIC